jgi:murein DD-endopeptidase MepM/ murein hydrolase activator NlpD
MRIFMPTSLMPAAGSGPTRARRRPFGRVLAVLLAGTLAVPGAAAGDDATDPDSLEEAKAEREQAREEQLRVQAELDLIAAEDIQVVEALTAATELVNLKQAEVDAATQRIAVLDGAVAQATADLVAAGQDRRVLRRLLREAALEAYVDQEQGDLTTLLAATDVSDAAGDAAIVRLVQSNGADLADQLRVVEQRRRDLLAEAEAARAESAAVRLELQWALEGLEQEQAHQQALKTELDRRREQWEAALAGFEQEEAELTAWIAAEQERLEAELAAQAAAAATAANPGYAPSGGGGANVGSVSGSGYQWPVSGNLGSGFGMRLHPILGYYRMHYGLDIGGNGGAPIWAAKDGIVITAGWQGGFGNCVVIAHDGGIATLYAHMSSIGVSVGQSVGRGSVIGYVGSTGLSTGPHLHFEVHQGGTPVDPRPFLP